MTDLPRLVSLLPLPGGAMFPRPVVHRDVGPEDAASAGAAVPLPHARGQHAVPQQPGGVGPRAPRTQVRGSHTGLAESTLQRKAGATRLSERRGAAVASRRRFSFSILIKFGIV